MQYTNAVRKLACGMLMLAIIPCGRIVKAASDGGEGEYRVHFTLPTEPFVKLGDSILYTTETDCRLPGGDWTPSPPSTITVLDPNGVQYQGEDSVTVTTTKTGDYTATASCNADPETTDDAITVTVLHTDIVQTDEEACIHGNASTLTLSAGDAGHVDSFDGGGGWTWIVNPAEGLDCSDDGYKTFTYTPAQSEPGSYAITAAADLLARCHDECSVTVVKVDLDVEGVADEDEADAPGALVCVTNGTAGAATRKQITVNKCAPASWDGQVTLLWSAGNVRVYTAPSNGVEVTSGTTFANTALPTNLWVEGIAVSDTAGDVVFRLNPRNVDCPHTATGCDRLVMTVIKVDTIDATSPKSGTSANPPPFPGHTSWPFDVTHSPNPDKHMVVFYKDVVDSSFNVDDFDVTLKANVLPTSITADQLNEVWSKISGPASGSLNRTDTFEIKYQNPKLGGVYRFDFDLGLSGCAKSEANVVLPLAGAEIDGVLRADLPKADAFATRMKARYIPRELNKVRNLRRWFCINYGGDYTGRPDNVNTPTVWVYNQVNDETGFGAVCTWRGRPVRLTKPSNFILGYAMQQIGISRDKARRGTGLFKITETTDRASVGAGWDLANGGNYDTIVSNLVDYIWTHEKEDDKSRKLWPNPNPPDNYRGSPNAGFDFNTGYGTPEFLFMMD